MAKDLHIGALLDVYSPFLSEKQRVIAEHYYFDDLSLSEIAENENISRQAVRDLIRRVGETLVAYEEKCGYYKKFTALKQLCDKETLDINEIKKITDSL